MSMEKETIKVSDDLPDKLLDKIYEYTQFRDSGGFIICHVSLNGNVVVREKTSSEVTRLALLKSLEFYLERNSPSFEALSSME